ncbi:MAG: hypothetical protein SFV54_07405 [Bryobacteraceae bacterium]|nr:hypothetical protein [Bryobacteraceae bacterium]
MERRRVLDMVALGEQQQEVRNESLAMLVFPRTAIDSSVVCQPSEATRDESWCSRDCFASSTRCLRTSTSTEGLRDMLPPWFGAAPLPPSQTKGAVAESA